MSHQEIILIVATISFISTFGVWIALKRINHYTNPPVNVLTRRGDIELVDYIEPVRPDPAYNPWEIDLLSTQTYERIQVMLHLMKQDRFLLIEVELFLIIKVLNYRILIVV
uniref:Uncharacterized protein n=1 Tax=Lactifluus hygrophoroides TaxID=1837245 RepID=A0A2Z4M974_9AGAM|nr:hypothetical protein [Lactifluus hygrophoroides]AWX52961.1 hypothetical protein [Lactifluus hygrophoroides]